MNIIIHEFIHDNCVMASNTDVWKKCANYLLTTFIVWTALSFNDILEDFGTNPYGKCETDRTVPLLGDNATASARNNCKGLHCDLTGVSGHRANPEDDLPELVEDRSTVERIHDFHHCEVKIKPSIFDKRKHNYGFFVASANKLPDFTTERSIFTGLVTVPPPTPAPKDFEFDAKSPSFATRRMLHFSWNATFNVTKIWIRYEEKDESIHIVEIPKINLTSNYTLNVFPPNHPRKGFRYTVVGFKKLTKYYLKSCAFLDNTENKICDTASFKTGESDRDERLYNLEGIFLVLGISTIIMVVVLCCVGYEKLLHQKKKQCVDFLCCRRKSKRNAKVHNRGSISPEPLMVRRDPNISPVEDDFATPGPSSYRR